MKAVVTFVARVLAWVVILGAAAIIAVAVVVPRVAGAEPYTILTGSMEPTLKPGTLVVVRPVDPAELSIGDIVTIQLESGKSTMVTHRIVGIGMTLDGELRFTTQGDANEIPDAEERLPIQIRGELWYQVPYVGYVSTAFTGEQRQWGVIAVAVALLGYAGWMFFRSWRKRGREDEREPTRQEPAAVSTAADESPNRPERGEVGEAGEADTPALIATDSAVPMTRREARALRPRRSTGSLTAHPDRREPESRKEPP